MRKVKTIIRIVSFCLCMFLVTAPIIGSAKEKAAVQPYMTYISNYAATLSINNGEASVGGFLNAKSGTTTTYIELTLQRKNGSSWDDVKTWKKSSTLRYISIAETYNVSKGTYRVFANVKANSESKTGTSAVVTY